MSSLAPKILPPQPVDATKVQLISWQEEAVNDIVEKLYGTTNYRGVLLRGGTGLGKMYIKALALADILRKELVIPVLWLCPKSVKLQTMRVLKDCGIAHLVMVMSYGQIKNNDGTSIFLQYITMPNPLNPIELDIIPVWHEYMLPAIVVADECHSLKNPFSLQSKVVRALPISVKRIFASATPFQRVGDARTLIEAMGAVTKHNAIPTTQITAPTILREIAFPKSLEEYSPSAVGRLRDELDPYIVELKNVRFKFPTSTICSLLNFRSREQEQAYNDAYEEYLREIREGRRKGSESHGRMAALVAMQKFQQKAELLRCPEIAERGVLRVSEGKQVIIASNYVDTLRSVWTHLVKVHNVAPEKIAFIVGGQSEGKIQSNVDNFNTGAADYILFTIKSGGAGISLHHDRPYPSRPRHIILPPTWSAIDLVQALGRGHRLTSISPTTQEILWFDKTVEVKVKNVVERKVKCLSKAVTAKEQFISLFERESGDDIDEEKNDEYNEIVESGKEHNEGDVDAAPDEEFSGEGLSNLEDTPTPYR